MAYVGIRRKPAVTGAAVTIGSGFFCFLGGGRMPAFQAPQGRLTVSTGMFGQKRSFAHRAWPV